MKRILITGGAGFVGSSLALRLKKYFSDTEIICMDNLYRNGSELNRMRIEKMGITFIESDVRNRDSFNIAACDLVIDAAAEPSVMAGGSGDADYVVDTNLGGTINLLEAARKWDAAFLFLSTSRVYPVELLRSISLDESDSRFELSQHQVLSGISSEGISEYFPLDILNSGCCSNMHADRTFYGATKYASEIMVREYAAYFGVRSIINRCGVIAGPWQMGKVDQGVTALWVASHIYGKSLSYIGYKGKQVRDVLHVKDLAELVIKEVERIDEWSGNIYNVGGGRNVSFSLLELTEKVSYITGKNIDINFVDDIRSGDIPIYLSDIRKVADEFKWSPKMKPDAVISDIVRWIIDNKDVLSSVFV